MRQLNNIDEILAAIAAYVTGRYAGEEPTELCVKISDGRQIVVPFPRAARMPATAPAAALPGSRHSVDYRSVQWEGREFVFSPNQAAVVKVLWEAMEDGTPEVGGDTLLEAAGSEAVRMRDVFRDHPAWGSLIVPGARRTYRLAME